MLVYFLYFNYIEKNLVHTIILFLLGDIFLFFSEIEKEYCFYYIFLCFLTVSCVLDCFRIKYIIPFFATVINEKAKKYLIFLNLLLTIDFNLYSFMFIFVNIFYSLESVVDTKKFYIFNFLSLFILLLFDLNQNLFKIFLFSYAIFSIFIYFYNKYIDTLIFCIVFVCFYFCRLIYNSNIKYELTELGFMLVILNYSILLSMVLIRELSKNKANKIKLDNLHGKILMIKNEY